MEKNNFKIEKIHCNNCLGKTKHFVIAERENSDSQTLKEFNQSDISWTYTYTMLECCGCANVTLRKQFYFSEYDDIDTEYYPPAISRQLPRWYIHLPSEIGGLLQEIYTALHADSRRLVIMGARAIVDLFLNDHVGDIGGFAKKIKELENKGLISKVHREILEPALEAGHAVTHRGHKPKKEEVSQVIDIVENLIEIYVLKKSAKKLKDKIPSHKKNRHKK